jgi:phosphatidylserine decarboxylase
MNHDSAIVREGLPFILPPAGGTAIALAAGAPVITGVLLLITLFVIWFFRNPDRSTPAGERLVISPADGKVIRIEEVGSEEGDGKRLLKISIFMNVFNVHVNRIPYAGRIAAVRYRAGRFLSADLDKASEVNERNVLHIQTADQQDIMVAQIAGLIARRIVCWVTEGMTVDRGQRFGMIRFGSRVELYLPSGTTLRVRDGDKVMAGETIIGEMT